MQAAMQAAARGGPGVPPLEAQHGVGSGGGEAGAVMAGAGLVYVCSLCDITATSPENLQAHFGGQPHRCAPYALSQPAEAPF